MSNFVPMRTVYRLIKTGAAQLRRMTRAIFRICLIASMGIARQLMRSDPVEPPEPVSEQLLGPRARAYRTAVSRATGCAHCACLRESILHFVHCLRLMILRR